MGKKLLLLITVIFIVTITKAQSAEEKIIRNTLTEQTAAWNAGDISQFMESYWNSDSLMFVGKNSVTYGWEQTKDNYIKSYPTTAAMGKLDFDILEVKRLSVMYFFVVGKWHLTRSAGNLEGHSTLLFKRIKNKWVIVCDHSS